MNKSESKYFNTAMRMDEAFLELLEHKDFAYITVKEICAKAGVNRSTFYLHYETISDLLEESLAYIQKKFWAEFSHTNFLAEKINTCPTSELMLLTPAYLEPYLSFVRAHAPLYRAAIARPAIFRSDETYRHMFQHIFDPILERFGVPMTRRRYYMMFYLAGISAVVGEWIQNDCEDDLDQMIAIIQNCVMPKEYGE